MEEEVLSRVYEYLSEYMKDGARPCQLARALGLEEKTVTSALRELERQGKIRLRTPNIEWHRRRQ